MVHGFPCQNMFRSQTEVKLEILHIGQKLNATRRGL
jgi:hypothetical protein